MRAATTGSIAGLLGLAAATALTPGLTAGAGAAGADRLVLGPPELPGLTAGRASTGAARRDLARVVGTRAARRARIEAAVFRRGRGAAAIGLSVQAHVLRSGPVARRALARWRTLTRRGGFRLGRVRLGEAGWVGTRAPRGRPVVLAVAFRQGAALAVLRLQLTASGPVARRLALSYGALQAARLRRALARTAWDRVLTGVPSNGIASRTTILQLFSLAYGRLPGVRLPGGSTRGPPVSGSWFVQRVLADLWPSLTRAQRRAVSRALWPPARRRDAARAAAIVDGCLSEVGGLTLDVAATHDARQLRAAENGHMPYATGQFEICAYSAPGGGDTLANTIPWYRDRPDAPNDGNQLYGPFPDMCFVRLYDGWRGLSATNRRTILGHEMFHCLHGEWGMRRKFFPNTFGPYPGANPQWTEDGLATWAGNQVAPGTFSPESKAPGIYHKAWLDHYQQLPLFQQSYEPFGFWGLIGQQAGPDAVWARINDIWNTGGVSSSIFDAGTSAQRASVLDRWGPGLFSQPAWPGGWQQQEPYAASIPISVDATVAVNGTTALATQPYAALKVQIAAASQRLVEVFVDGHGSLTDGTKQWEAPHNVWLCLGGGCACPAGQHEQTPIPAHTDTGALVYAGLAGDQSPTRLTLGGHDLSEYCVRDDRPRGGGGGGSAGCNSGCGGSNGDPHMRTIDGRFYDFMAAGEFTVVKSKADDLEIQARQEPVRARFSLLTGLLSVNTAVAVRVAGTRVGVYGPKGKLSVRVNGRPVQAPAGAGLRLPGGGTLANRRGHFVVTWPDGSEVRVWSVGGWGVSFLVAPSRARKGMLTGLLGNFDGDRENDFVTRAGRALDGRAVLGGRGGFALLYRTFGDSWRIRQADSLFDYAKGRSTRSYTRRNFPRRSLTVAGLPAARRRAGRRACRAAGVKDSQRFAACVIDVGATGDRSFARDAGTAEATATPPQPTLGWTKLSAEGDGTTAAASLAQDGERAVVAYTRNNAQEAEAATFTAASSGPTAVTRAPIATGWSSVGVPYLGPRPGGGVHAVFQGIHSFNNADPLNATVFVARNPDGSFAAPAPASPAYFSTPSGPPVVAADGATPLWPASLGGSLSVWRGSSDATSSDLSPRSPGPAIAPQIAHDRSGRLWLAWYVLGDATTTGLYMLQLDPATGDAAGSASVQHAPASRAGANNGPPVLACAQICRLVYRAESADGGNGRSLLSWAPGEAGPATITSDPPQPRLLGAAAAPDGRLWTAWFDDETSLVTAKLGDATGAGGESVLLRTPSQGALPSRTEALALPGRLVLAGLWGGAQGTAQWGAVVPAPGG